MEETAHAIAEVTVQTPFWSEHLDAIITILITIAGFVVTYLMTKQNFKDEVKKNKLALAAEQIQSLPYDICQLMDDMLKSKQNRQQDIIKQYGSILSKVLAYGSSQAVKIAIKMQRTSYDLTSQASEDDRFPILAAYSLLITQIKYDLTSEIISPESWFQLHINDYGKDKLKTSKIKKAINNIVQELDLNSSFKV